MLEFAAPPTAGLPLRLADLRPWGREELAPALAQWLGLASVQLTCSGTSALLLALRTLRALEPQRDEVIVPAYTCPLVALAVARCGLRLRLCDLRSDALDMDGDVLRSLCGPQTLAVLPTHLCGRVADVAQAMACARVVGAYVIEDAAQALGARVGLPHGEEPVGWQGHIGFYSLAVGKGLTTFEGGVLVARDAGLRAALARAGEQVRPSRLWELRRSLELLGYAALYRPQGLGLAYGMPLKKALARGDWVAAAGDDFDDFIPQHPLGRWRQRVGARALQRLPAFLQQTAQQAAGRCARLAAIPGVEIVGHACAQARGTWPVILLRLPTAAARNALVRRHWGDGSGLSLPFVHVLPDYGRYDHVLTSARCDRLERARDWAARLVAISNSPWLDEARFDRLLFQIAISTGAGSA
ncbi:DegT/DnrJ/EryC1/StrS family aminotransferase [Comamonas composti]|uniref:DegT/DnrJ/EryC1/StrS family aminotransferase n=1 Tax=Comamonas composti TaxID=408558 RepID=UPI00047EF77A|nr:DegT/DnrJ/EryC1/StrS family aminotransferase [Comamonas composti]